MNRRATTPEARRTPAPELTETTQFDIDPTDEEISQVALAGARDLTDRLHMARYLFSERTRSAIFGEHDEMGGELHKQVNRPILHKVLNRYGQWVANVLPQEDQQYLSEVMPADLFPQSAVSDTEGFVVSESELAHLLQKYNSRLLPAVEGDN